MTFLQDTEKIITRYVIPTGIFVLLTGMFWIGDRSLYHRAFYLLVATPTLFALASRLREIRDLTDNPTFIAFAAFAAYTLVSLLWSGTDDAGSVAKYPFYVLILFLSMGLVALGDPKLLERVLKASVACASLAALVSLILFFNSGGGTRLPGYGALYNPLLTSHVYGMFTAAAIAFVATQPNRKILWSISLIPLGGLLLATGSRTPLLALAAALAWLLLSRPGRQSLALACILIAGAVGIAQFAPDEIVARGLSYRPDIWYQAWLQISDNILFGYGYDHPMAFHIEALGTTFTDPHNMTLAVLFSGGLAGLMLWITLYGVSMAYCWKNRERDYILVLSTMLVFGFVAGMTEGGSFISRPKEHWFLIWIPLALLSAVQAKRSKEKPSTEKDL